MDKKFKEWEEASTNFNFDEKFVYKQIKRNKQKVFFKRLIQATACVFAFIFVLANTSVEYINATKDIPLLNKINSLVNFNKSLFTAVENDYVQALDILEEKDGLKVQVNSVVVDEKEIYVFYDITYKDKELEKEEYDIDYPDFEGSSLMDHFKGENSQVSMHEVVNTLELIDNYYLEFNYKYIQLKVNIPIDKERIAKHRTYEPNEVIDIHGQKLVIKKVEVYPLATRIYYEEDEENTQKLEQLKFRLVVDGIEVDRKSLVAFNGVYYLESPYFIEEDYEIILDSVVLTPKPAKATFNLKTGEYKDPTGLTSLKEYDRKYHEDFDAGDESYLLNRKVVIESTNQHAIDRGQFITTSVSTSNVITWYTSYEKDMSKVYNTLTFYVDDEIEEIELYIYAGEYVEVNQKVDVE